MTAPDARPVVLRTEALTKSFPGVRAFTKVDFDLLEGEVHCVVGENGAGKSTFIKLLSGVLTPDSGTICIGESRFGHVTPRLAKMHGIQTVFQEIELAPSMTVAENLFIGNEITGAAGLIDYAETAKRAAALLAEFEIPIRVSSRVRNLSLVEQEIVQIVKALSTRPRILILDEATASFSQKEIRRLLDLVREISRRGVAVIYISHHIEEVFGIADRITVLRDGCKVGCYRKDELDVDRLVALILGSDARTFYMKKTHPVDESASLEVRNAARTGFFKDISFTVRAGEVLGIAGPIGAGKTELARMIFGLDRMDSGGVFLGGREITARGPADAIESGVCLLTENRRLDGLLLRRPLSENVTFAGLKRFRGLFIQLGDEKVQVQELIRQLDIKCTGSGQVAGKLSGGNQQKVVLAKWFFIEPRVYIFDEPTVGVDVGAKQEIYALISALADQGKIIIIISSDLPELAALCTRVLIVKDRRIRGELAGDTVTEQNILKAIISEEGQGSST